MKIFGKEISRTDAIFFLIVLILIIILYFFYKKNKRKSAKLSRIIDELIPLYPNIRNLDIRAKFTCSVEDSYTEDKKIIYICICDEEGEFYSDNKIKQIIIHELAHKLSVHIDEEHRGVEFNGIYQDLMKRAIILNVIDNNKLQKGEFYPDGRKRKYLKKEGNDEELQKEERELVQKEDGLEDVINTTDKKIRDEKIAKQIFKKDDDSFDIKFKGEGDKEDSVKVVFDDEDED